jgi:hypothetical protein
MKTFLKQTILFSIFTAGLFLLFATQAQAHQFHTPNYCHSEQKDLCAHVGYNLQPKANEEFQFMVHVMAPDVELEKISDLGVELDMPSMGHGSAPVSVERKDLRHFAVTQAYFLMEGEWMINIDIKKEGQTYRLQIPFLIQ